MWGAGVELGDAALGASSGVGLGASASRPQGRAVDVAAVSGEFGVGAAAGHGRRW